MINWKIEHLIVKPQDGSYADVVVTAHWRCNGTQGEFAASNYGSAGFAAPGETFIPFESLTEAEVLAWVWANGVDKDSIEANVARALADLANPPVVDKPLPWSGAA